MKKVYIEKDKEGVFSLKEASDTGKEIYLPDAIWAAEVKYRIKCLEYQGWLAKTNMMADMGLLTEEKVKETEEGFEKAMAEAEAEEAPQKVGFV